MDEATKQLLEIMDLIRGTAKLLTMPDADVVFFSELITSLTNIVTREYDASVAG